jgi:DNA primase large subunit
MIVYQNHLITLTYTPESDTLMIDWPDVESYTFPEVRESFQKIVEVLKNYDVKNLLLDASTGFIRLKYSEFLTLIREFATNLLQTRLQKFARVLPKDPEREESVKTIQKELANSYQYRDFKSKAAALRWFQSGKL